MRRTEGRERPQLTGACVRVFRVNDMSEGELVRETVCVMGGTIELRKG